MRKIVQKNEVSIMKLSARRFCRILHHLSQNPGRKDAEQALLDGAVCINLPATFQFSAATSKSIDIPDCQIKILKIEASLHSFNCTRSTHRNNQIFHFCDLQ